MTRLSVVMSVRNGMPHLPHAMRSVLDQLGPDDEFLIRNDGSEDSTQEVIDGIDDSRIRVFAGAGIGLAASLNQLLDHVRGDHVARMDADDVSLPGRFESQMDELEARGLDLISSARCRIDADGYVLDEGDPRFGPDDLKRFNGFTHGSWLFRRRLVEEEWRYDEKWETAQDYELLLRLHGAGIRLGVSDEITYHQRVHDRSTTQSRGPDQLRSMLLAQEHYWESCGGTPQADAELAITRWRLGKRLGVIIPLTRCLLAGDLTYPLREIRYYRGNPDFT